MRQLKWRDIVRPDDVFHLARVRVDADYDTPLHTHDFAEVFWVEQGIGMHHVNGRSHALAAGSLATIRPSDAHALQATDDQGFVLVNLAFATHTLDFLATRYGILDQFFWTGEAMPWSTTMTPTQRRSMQHRVEALAAAPQHQIALDHFLIGLLCELNTSETTHARTLPAGSPVWIAVLLEQVRQPDHFALGVHHVAQLAHRAPEHVTRELKRYTGMTTVQWITKARLDFAERQLRVTTEEISQIALTCGFNSLAHFYKVFRARFGLAPHAYRVRHQATVR